MFSGYSGASVFFYLNVYILLTWSSRYLTSSYAELLKINILLK